MPAIPAEMGTAVWVVSVVIALIGTAGIGGMFKTWLDHTRGVRATEDASALSLIEAQRLALEHANERIDRLERASTRKDELHELRMAQLRHRLNNMRMVFEVAIRLMKTSSSDRMPEIVEMIEQMRAKHEAEEAAENATIAAALASGAADQVSEYTRSAK